MDTTIIVAFRHPSQVKLLLEALAMEMEWVARESQRCTQRSDLPSSLQRIAMAAERLQEQWLAWIHQETPRLYVASIASAEARQLGMVALNLAVFNERGLLRHRGLWVQQRDGRWKCRHSHAPAASVTQTKPAQRQPSSNRPGFFR